MPDPFPSHLLKKNTGTVPKKWHNPNFEKRGAEFQTNVIGVNWDKQTSKWRVEHISAETNEREYVGLFHTWEEACAKRASLKDGTPEKGQVRILDGEVCVDKCNNCWRKNLPVEEYQPNTSEKI